MLSLIILSIVIGYVLAVRGATHYLFELRRKHSSFLRGFAVVVVVVVIAVVVVVTAMVVMVVVVVVVISEEEERVSIFEAKVLLRADCCSL
jgi:hypothetical protein